MSRAIHLPLLAAALCVFTGCGDPPAKPANQPSAKSAAGDNESSGKKKYRIAVIPKGTLHEFWKSIHAGAIKAERELGNVEIIWKGPAREDDREQQINVVETFVNQGVDAIVLAPLDKKSLVGPVALAKERNVPVVIIDSALDKPDLTVAYVATDNYNGGVIAADYVAKLLGGKGNVVVLRYQLGSASTEMREAGFLDTLKKKHAGITILSEEQYSGTTREDAMAKSENLLTRFGDKIDAWFCPCEPVTYGTLRALQNKGLAGKVKLVGFDSATEMVAGLKKGEIHGLILQDPINMGYLGVKSAVEHLQGKKIEKVIPTGENLVTPENMDQPRQKELLSPDLSKWLAP